MATFDMVGHMAKEQVNCCCHLLNVSTLTQKLACTCIV